mmetsp:Transcript_65768/g.182261  ORF Transcript_65768/g.182261 Transcript_65768/m.182261 type:complete len:109 (-) Transcript_65768:256-582(-)
MPNYQRGRRGLRGQEASPVVPHYYGWPTVLQELDDIKPVKEPKQIQRKVTFSQTPTERLQYEVDTCEATYAPEKQYLQGGQHSSALSPGLGWHPYDLLEVMRCCYRRD